MWLDLCIGTLIPLIGTACGAALVFFIRNRLNDELERTMLGFAAGIMTAASFLSLLLPSLEESAHMGRLSFVPAVTGFWIGILFLFTLDEIIPHLHLKSTSPEGPKTRLDKVTMLVLAVTLHNIPEGMAVGAVLAGWMADSSITYMAAISLSLGIAIQNCPEGALISVPLRSLGVSRIKSFLGGIISGLAGVLGTLLMIFAASTISSYLPYILSFAAGAMIYVVVEDLIPEMSKGKHSNMMTLTFAFGFTCMLILDVALG